MNWRAHLCDFGSEGRKKKQHHPKQSSTTVVSPQQPGYRNIRRPLFSAIPVGASPGYRNDFENTKKEIKKSVNITEQKIAHVRTTPALIPGCCN